MELAERKRRKAEGREGGGKPDSLAYLDGVIRGLRN